MQIIREERLLDSGPFSTSQAWRKIEVLVRDCMRALEWPPGSGKFTLHDQSGKKHGQGSGVKLIKDDFMSCLKKHGWLLQHKVNTHTRKPGPFDAAHPVGSRFFALEWETGNVSSSHRSLNRMMLGSCGNC